MQTIGAPEWDAVWDSAQTDSACTGNQGYWFVDLGRPPGMVSRNITSHATAGLSGWSDVEIKAAITQGLHRDGTKLKPPMAFSLYATMTDKDLSSLVAYLRTVPPKE